MILDILGLIAVAAIASVVIVLVYLKAASRAAAMHVYRHMTVYIVVIGMFIGLCLIAFGGVK